MTILKGKSIFYTDCTKFVDIMFEFICRSKNYNHSKKKIETYKDIFLLTVEQLKYIFLKKQKFTLRDDFVIHCGNNYKISHDLMKNIIEALQYNFFRSEFVDLDKDCDNIKVCFIKKIENKIRINNKLIEKFNFETVNPLYLSHIKNKLSNAFHLTIKKEIKNIQHLNNRLEKILLRFS